MVQGLAAASRQEASLQPSSLKLQMNNKRSALHQTHQDLQPAVLKSSSYATSSSSSSLNTTNECIKAIHVLAHQEEQEKEIEEVVVEKVEEDNNGGGGNSMATFLTNAGKVGKWGYLGCWDGSVGCSLGEERRRKEEEESNII